MVTDLLAALANSVAEAKALRPEPRPDVTPCLCGSTDTRGRIIAEPIDLTEADAREVRNEGQQMCRACAHGIAHRAMSVHVHYSATSTVRDRYHPECVRL